MRLRRPFVLVAVATAFAAGLFSAHCVRDARAQGVPFAATIYVPSDGLAFRAFDGRVVARLSYDENGGVFELFDQHEQPAGRVAASALRHGGSTPAAVTPRPVAAPPATASETDLGF